MVVLEVGLKPASPIEGADNLAGTEAGFFRGKDGHPVEVGEGVFAAGAALGPCAVSEACAQGAAAAAQAAIYLSKLER
jgi:heterodisulfide reductase subunit A-like polyferredoxin